MDDIRKYVNTVIGQQIRWRRLTTSLTQVTSDDMVELINGYTNGKCVHPYDDVELNENDGSLKCLKCDKVLSN